MQTTDSAPASPGAVERENRPLHGILFLLLATTLFPLQDVIIKGMSDGYAVHQIVFFRGIFALPLVLVIVHLDTGLHALKFGPIRMQLFRAAAGFTSYLVYYMALATLGMAETAAITFSTPLFVTLLAVFFLGETIGLHRWLAVTVGLVGVVIAMRPGYGVFEPAALLALGAALSYGVSIILTRRLGNRTNGSSLTLFATCFFTLGGAGLGLAFDGAATESAHPSVAFLYRPWIWPAAGDWPLLASLGCISAIGFFSLSQAYRLADASVVTPLEYAYLPWAVLWGYVFFGNLPGLHTWAGLVLIVGAGLYVIYRETARGRKLVRWRGLGIFRQR
ncbi:MAG TPA: DMT family transporter [Thermohalobaculum sp.]|nr:DMT family transporter [Thermohalobaculum sp.]